MLNVIDIVLAVLILFYLLKNAGGIVRTFKNIIVVLLVLFVLGIVVRMVLDSSLISGSARKILENSYFVKLSYSLIKWSYPAVEKNAPKIDAYIKEKIISSPTPEVTTPKVSIPPIRIHEEEINKLLYPEKYKPAKSK